MIVFGCDHGGFILKEQLKLQLHELDHEVLDLGAFEFDNTDDYPLVAHQVAEKMLELSKLSPDSEQAHIGVLICTTAGGVMIAANRHLGIRAVHCSSIEEALHARAHNHANVLGLSGAQFLDGEVSQDKQNSQSEQFDAAKQIVLSFLQTPWDLHERHVRRVNQIEPTI